MEALFTFLILAAVVSFIVLMLQRASTQLTSKRGGDRRLPRTHRNRSPRSTHRQGPPRASRPAVGSSTSSLGIQVTFGSRGDLHRSPQRSKKKPDELWVPPGQEVTVQGFRLPGGMVYVGKSLAAADSDWTTEPALIDPDLPIKSPTNKPEALGYWPSYAELDPAARGAYLQWLADGRRAPDIPVGYVFLFFYGLERRFLKDRETSEAARREAPRVIAEVERLLGLYGEHGSFQGYASRFLAYARCEQGLPPAGVSQFQASDFEDAAAHRQQLSEGLRWTLGYLVSEGKPIPPTAALAWYRCGFSLRTPARRCWDLFLPLFEQYYHGEYGKGMILEPNRTRLEISYSAASGGIRSSHRHATDLPDVAQLSAPLRRIGEIVVQANDDLDAYSRWLGRNADADNHLPGIALVPKQVFRCIEDSRLQKLRIWLAETCEGETTAVPGRELIAHWPAKKADRLNKKEAAGLAQLLDRLGFGLEPDVRFGGKPLTGEQTAILFRLREAAPEAPSTEYATATVLLHLATAVAAADGMVVEEEERLLEQHLEEVFHLEIGERHRLRAHLTWLLNEQPSLAGMKRRLTELTEDHRHALATFAVTVSGADGRIDPQEVKTLRRIYKLLGLDESKAFSDIHALETGSGATDTPVTVVPGQPRPEGYRVPPREPPREPSGSFTLDMAKVQRKREESAEAARILGDIFRQDDDPTVHQSSSPPAASEAVPSSPTPTEDPFLIPGLDTDHSALLRCLGHTESLPRGKFDALAENLGLLPAGALDQLNDAAFEICDEPVLEGDDPLEVNPFAMKEMTS